MKRLWVDDHGIYRAEFDGDEAIIGWFLEQDVQSSQNSCQEYIAALEAIGRGEIKTWEGTGNAFTVCANGEMTTISCCFTDDRLGLPTLQLVEHLNDWLSHLRRP